MTWHLEWNCWSGPVEAKIHKPENGPVFGLDLQIISVWENDFGTCVVLDTPENRRALEAAAKKGLGRNALEWERLPRKEYGVGTVPAFKTVR